MKYYVSSGNNDLLIAADSPKDAAIAFVRQVTDKNAEEVYLGLVLRISEIGFGDEGTEHEEHDMYMLTENVLKETGRLGDFQ